MWAVAVQEVGTDRFIVVSYPPLVRFQQVRSQVGLEGEVGSKQADSVDGNLLMEGSHRGQTHKVDQCGWCERLAFNVG